MDDRHELTDNSRDIIHHRQHHYHHHRHLIRRHDKIPSIIIIIIIITIEWNHSGEASGNIRGIVHVAFVLISF